MNENEKIKNYMIPEKIKDICRSCEENIHCQGKGCAFRSLGNEYCDYVLNATRLYLDLQQRVEQLENIRKEAITYILTHCEIIRHINENVDEVGNVNGGNLLNILNKGE